jgi:peptide deformylase
MSHLKKLSDRLKKDFLVQAKPVSIIGVSKSMTLESPAYRYVSITRTMRDYQIPTLKLSASHLGLVSLSGNQIGFSTSMFVINKNLEQDKWTNYRSQPEDYEVYINPLVNSVSSDFNSGLEECPSVPNILAQIERNDSIDVEYIHVDHGYIQENIDGFKARVFMHEVDHLWGFLISSFTVSSGRLIVKDKLKNPEVAKFLEENRERFEKWADDIEAKYIKISKNAKSDDRSYCEREVIDHELEEEFNFSIVEAYFEDLNK